MSDAQKTLYAKNDLEAANKTTDPKSTSTTAIVDQSDPDFVQETVDTDGNIGHPAVAVGQDSGAESTNGLTPISKSSKLGGLLCRFIAELRADDHQECTNLAKLIAREHLSAAKKVVLGVLSSPNLITHQRRWGVQELVSEHAARAHSFYHDGDQAYVAWDGTVIPLHDERDRLYASLHRDYGLARGLPALKGLGEKLYQHALDKGEQVTTLTLARFDGKTNTSYLHNQGTQVLRIRAEKVDVLINGADRKLFLPDPSGKAFATNGDWDRPEGDPFVEHVLGGVRFGGGVLTHDESVLLCRAWRLAPLMTPEGGPRPILALIGSRGSGKSTLATRLGQVVIGSQFTVSLNHGGERDERIALCRKAFMVLDNLERISKRTEDNLCTAVSGGSVGLRVQRTTDRYIDVPIRPWIVTTNQVMPTDRSDLLERCIFLPLERLSSYSSSMATMADDDIRRSILQQMVWDAHQLVKRREGNTWTEYAGGYRMADFAALVVNLAGIYDVPELGHLAIKNLVNEVETEQTLEKPTIELIEFWLLKKGAEVLGREFATRELGIELEGMQKEAGVAFPEKGRPDKLGQFLTYHQVSLAQDYGFASRRVGGRKRRVKFTKLP